MLHTTFASVLFLSAMSFAPTAGLLAQNPLVRDARTEHPFAGAFAGQDIALDLGPGQDHEYQGTLTFDGQRYPCTGDAKVNALKGSFTVNGKSFAFTAKLDGDKLTLSSDGTDYELSRQNPQNPLPRGQRPQPHDQPTPTNQPPRHGTAPTVGGVGIGFEPNSEGDLVVKVIMPNGPASKTGLKPGGVLVAVDGKDIDDITPEKLRAMLQGPIGSLVKLTIETDTEVLDVVIQRGEIPANTPPPAREGDRQPPQPQPPQPQPPQPWQGGQGQDRQQDQQGQRGDDERNDAPAVTGMPAWLREGARVTWWAGSATLPGVSAHLVQNANGTWVDRNGQRYASETTAGSGGMGYQQLNLVHVGADGIAAEMRTYVVADPQTNAATLTSSAGYTSTTQNIGDYWISPQQLRQMQDGVTAGTRIVHGPYTLEGRQYDCVAVRTDTDAGFSQYTYDLATGLCLASSTSGTSAPVWVANGNTTAPGAGSTFITQTHLVGMRQLQLPWAGDGLPQGLRAGANMSYRGSYSTEIPGSPVMPWQFASTVQIDKVSQGFATGKVRTRLDSGMGMPQEGEEVRVFGANMIGALFVSPQTLQQLQAQQVIDQDPVTRVRTYVGESQNGAVTIVEQGPQQESRFAYDRRNGMLVAYSLRQQNGIGTTVIQVQLTR